MNFENIAIGTDIEEVERFNNKTKDNNERFLNRIFTKNELDYCFSKKNFAQHLCARFCAKEAVYKALSELDIKDVYLKDIEILKKDNSIPFVKIEKYPNLKIRLSLSHTRKYACANVFVYYSK